MTLASNFISINNLPGSSFKSSHPVNFSLFDQNNHYALYIDDSNALGQPLIFEVHNRSDRAITFVNGQGETASAANYHFELQFRSGVLSSNTMGKLQDPAQRGEIFNDTANWDIFTSGQAEGVDHISLYLLHKGDSQWEPHSRRSLRFNGVNASAVGGARGAQVVMLTNQLVFADSSAPLTGRRRHHMSIINHRGTKNIPLHVGFKGSNQVLNSNGALSNLTLQVVNNLRLAQTHADIPAIILNAAPPGQPFSRFVLEFDVQQEGEMKAWALARANELGELTVTAHIIRRGKEEVDDTVPLKVTSLAAGQSPSRQWEIAPTQNTVLNPLDTIEINLVDIVTSLPTGSTNLYLHYDNISGYQDGRFVIPILKSPLMFSGGNVGIGTSNPGQKLDVAGNIVGANLSLARTNISRGALFLATSGDFNHALYNNYSNVDGEGAQDSAKWNVFAGLNIRTGSGTQKKTALAIDVNGKVGIGTASSEAKLQIINANQNAHGGTLILGPTDQANLRLGYDQDYSWIQSHGLKPLAINPVGNNVGIGTSEPQDMLHVQGTTRVTGDLRLEGNIYKKAGDWWYLPLEIPPVPKIWPAPPPVTAIDAIWRKPSDGRLKHQVRQIDQALAKIAKLQGITFEWNDTGLRHLTRAIETHISAGPGATEQANQQAQAAARQVAYQALSGSNIGLVAQDVEQVLPELVDTDEAGYKNLRYDLVTALLVEAVKELIERVEALVGVRVQSSGAA